MAVGGFWVMVVELFFTVFAPQDTHTFFTTIWGERVSYGAKNMGAINLMQHSALQNSLTRLSQESLSLDSTCTGKVTLLSKAEYVSPATSLIGVPGLAVHNTHTLTNLACTSAKTINHTSTAISLLNQEQRQLHNAILDNHAALDLSLIHI